MKIYTIKMTFVFVAIVISTYLGSLMSHLKLGNSIYFAALFQLCVFLLLNYYVSKGSSKNPNSQIRRIMIASMLRMFIILIFLIITMFNQPKTNIPWTVAYSLFFLLYLIFDISKKKR